MAEAQEKPLYELLTHSLVDIYVGPENTHWILHEKLLCTRSPFFAKIFRSSKSAQSTKSFGLPDEEDEPFRQFVGWLYSGVLRQPEQEADLGPLFDLYLMGEKWAVAPLVRDVLATVRAFYARTDSYPGLRRVQYVFANTEAGSPMRAFLIGAVARMLALAEDAMPPHWEKALRNNGQLAVDILLTISKWALDKSKVPDVRKDEQVEKVSEDDVKAQSGGKVKTEEGEQRISLREGEESSAQDDEDEAEQGEEEEGEDEEGEDEEGEEREEGNDEDQNEDQDEEVEQEEGEQKQEQPQDLKKRKAQLPNGINGVDNDNPNGINGVNGDH